MINILLIEDEPAHVELVARAFEHRNAEVQLIVASSLAESRTLLDAFTPDLVIADWRLPDGESLDLLQNNTVKRNIPLMLMTSYGNEQLAVSAIKAGALDYVVKSSETLLDMPHLADRALRQWEANREQERLRQALQDSEKQFRLLAENSSDMISCHDWRGIFLYASPASRTILGYEPEELVGKGFFSFLEREDVEVIRRQLRDPAQNDTSPIPFRARAKNGDMVWLETTVRVMRDPATGEVQEFQAASRDISERKQAQMQLQYAHDDLQAAYDRTIEGWVMALDLRDKETEGHTQRVTDLTVCLARELGFAEDEIIHIRRGALLHDIGKMGIPDEVLQKSSGLTPDEWVIMRRHPVYAYHLLQPIDYLWQAVPIPYCHHEHWDGSGYPRGLRGEDIPLTARLFSVVDVWDALNSNRAYRKKWMPGVAAAYIQQQSGSLFEPRIVEVFLKLLSGITF